MITTTFILTACILFYLCFAVYDYYVIYSLKGATKLTIQLRRRGWYDGIIYVALISLVIYQGLKDGSYSASDYYLMGILIVIGYYHFFIRRPTMLVKKDGFIFAGLYMEHKQLSGLYTTEKGQLVLEFKHIAGKKVLIDPININDIDMILQFYIDKGMINQERAKHFEDLKRQYREKGQNNTADMTKQ